MTPTPPAAPIPADVALRTGDARHPPSAHPRVRVVVLNWNGGEMTLRCLRYLRASEWPADRLEIVVVDNASTDGSVDDIHAQFPEVRIVQSGDNHGFVANNLAMTGLTEGGVDHVALINNDAFVDPGWLRPLVDALESDLTLGAACARMVLVPEFREVVIDSPTFAPPGDGRRLGVRLHDIQAEGVTAESTSQYVGGVHILEHDEDGATFRWTDARAVLRVALPLGPDGEQRPAGRDGARLGFGFISLKLSAERDKEVVISSGRYRLHARVGPQPRWIEVPHWDEPCDVINNAGSVLIEDGFGGDRGFWQIDRGQFDEPADVFNWCGGAVLLRRQYLEHVGLFDERFFLYYEDTDLSWRGGALGWRYRYVPESRVRHLHSATTGGQGSDVFHFFVERNRLLMLAKNAPPGLAWSAPVRFLLSTASYARRDVVGPLLHRQPPDLHLTRRRLRSFGAFVKHLPGALADRGQIERRRSVGHADLAARFLPRREWIKAEVAVTRPTGPLFDGVASTERPDPWFGGRSRSVPAVTAAPPGQTAEPHGRRQVAVYDQWWPTAGGGEKFAAGIAAVLAEDADVTLLAHEPIDLDALGERLQLDLSRVGVEVIDLGQASVEEASTHYDLLVNASYTSCAVNQAQRGLYVVHFATPPPADPPGWKSELKRRLRPVVATPGVSATMARGFHPDEMIGRHRVRWTTGDAGIDVHLPARRAEEVQIGLGRFFPAELPPVPVTIEVDGRRAVSLVVRPFRSRLERGVVNVSVPVVGRADGRPVRIRILSSSHVPAEIFGTHDDRRLGVPVTGVQVGHQWQSVMRRRYPSLAAGPGGFDWVGSYDRVVSNSDYTREWVRRWWQIDTGVLNPPVTLQQRGEKDRSILNVGRFFAPEHGHSKKQLEMVRAMRALQWRGHLDGWTLHLVGGCSEADRPYLEKVRREATGLPVELHVGASGSELRDLYGRASIYWHATGLGENPDTQPDRFEHFGITTVEAMSAGAVPVVIGAAGQLEVIEHGVSGLNWEPLVQLVCFTEELALDPERLAKMSAAAEARAQRYGMDAFADRLNGIVAGLFVDADADTSG